MLFNKALGNSINQSGQQRRSEDHIEEDFESFHEGFLYARRISKLYARWQNSVKCGVLNNCIPKTGPLFLLKTKSWGFIKPAGCRTY